MTVLEPARLREYERIKTEISINKQAIIAHVKETGEIPEGCSVAYGHHLVIA